MISTCVLYPFLIDGSGNDFEPDESTDAPDDDDDDKLEDYMLILLIIAALILVLLIVFAILYVVFDRRSKRRFKDEDSVISHWLLLQPME